VVEMENGGWIDNPIVNNMGSPYSSAEPSSPGDNDTQCKCMMAAFSLYFHIKKRTIHTPSGVEVFTSNLPFLSKIAIQAD